MIMSSFHLFSKDKTIAGAGFTLIELSIVLVIIALVVGGILVGRDLVSASAVRAQISQIEKFQQATNTFHGKYSGLPGDLSASLVAKFNFPYVPSRAGTTGQGDGDGIMMGLFNGGTDDALQNGELTWFWMDLSANAKLIEGAFTAANPTPTTFGTPRTSTSSPLISALLPTSKLSQSANIYVYSQNGVNYLSIAACANLDGWGSITNCVPGVTVSQAYNIDKKMDDGLPTTGAVTAQYADRQLQASTGPNYDSIVWAQGNGVMGPSDTTATTGTSTTCYDNNHVGGATQQYSMTQNNGTGGNCGLAFKFQ